MICLVGDENLVRDFIEDYTATTIPLNLSTDLVKGGPRTSNTIVGCSKYCKAHPRSNNVCNHRLGLLSIFLLDAN